MSYIGSSTWRKEDARLVSGEGLYASDVRPPGCLEASFVRSPVAHGVLVNVDAEAARRTAGVFGAWSAKDLPENLAAQPMFPSESVSKRKWPALADRKVRFVGQTVAVVLAGDRYLAEDGADAVRVEIGALEATLDPSEAAKSHAPPLFEGVGNVIEELEAGEPVPSEVWQEAAVVVEAAYRQPRLAPTSMEARAFVAKPEESGGLTVWCSHQAPHRLRSDLAGVLGVKEERLRVISPDVGGAFGAKSETFPEYVVIAHLAHSLKRPVRWVEDRREALFAATHGRGQNQRVRLAADGEGRMLALEVEVAADVGAYGHFALAALSNTSRHVAEVYATPRVHARVRAVATNNTPTAPYRGAGRPEAAYAVERTVDLLARRLGMDPARLRKLNFVPPTAMPYTAPTGSTHDSGDYAEILEKALAAADYSGWRAEQAKRRKSNTGLPLGIGICSYVEGSGAAGEYAAVEVGTGGEVLAFSGACSTGQGHETTFCQVVASVLGVDLDLVRLVERDTARVPRGVGSFASRSMQTAGAALYEAALGVVEEARARAAGLFGESVEEVGYEGGVLRARKQSLSLEELVERTGPVRAEVDLDPPQSFPYGCYVAVVEVDPELGDVRILRLIAADDCGVTVNPTVVEGQVRGGVAQGLGQTFYEEMPYDSDGRPLAETLLDYLLPTVAEMPPLRIEETQTPNPNTRLGAKGAGEAGAIGTPPAVVNAVADALDLEDPGALQIPLTPQEVCRAAASQATKEAVG